MKLPRILADGKDWMLWFWPYRVTQPKLGMEHGTDGRSHSLWLWCIQVWWSSAEHKPRAVASVPCSCSACYYQQPAFPGQAAKCRFEPYDPTYGRDTPGDGKPEWCPMPNVAVSGPAAAGTLDRPCSQEHRP